MGGYKKYILLDSVAFKCTFRIGFVQTVPIQNNVSLAALG